MWFSKEALEMLQYWIDDYYTYDTEEEWRKTFDPAWCAYWQEWFPAMLFDLEWEHLSVIGHGSYSVVFATGKHTRTAVKVAPKIEDDEIRRQNYFAEREMAVPVFHVEELTAPPQITRLCCYKHGLPHLPRSWCTCHNPLTMALMPRVEPLIPDWDDPAIWAEEYVIDPEVLAFMRKVDQECQNMFHKPWDMAERNVGRFQGKLVALDFGQPDLDH